MGRRKVKDLYVQCVQCLEYVPMTKVKYKFEPYISMTADDKIITCYKCDCPHFIVGVREKCT